MHFVGIDLTSFPRPIQLMLLQHRSNINFFILWDSEGDVFSGFGFPVFTLAFLEMISYMIVYYSNCMRNRVPLSKLGISVVRYSAEQFGV